VALKTIRHGPARRRDKEIFQRAFVIEAQAAGGLAHPGIVAIYDTATKNAYAILRWNTSKGQSAECFEQKVTFTIAQIVNIVKQLLEALQYAHDRGVWTATSSAKSSSGNEPGQVTDFGICPD